MLESTERRDGAGKSPAPNQKPQDKRSFTMAKIETTWRLISYDVWGNARDGYEVNDCRDQGTVEIIAEIVPMNAGTPHEFPHADIADKAIKAACGIHPNVRITTDGDGEHIYITRDRDGYPLCELHLESPDDLDPDTLRRMIADGETV